MLFKENRAKNIRFKGGKLMSYAGKDEDGLAMYDDYDYTKGFVSDIKKTKFEYQNEQIDQFEIYLNDKQGAGVILTLSYKTYFTRKLLNSLANADLSKQVELGAYMKDGYQVPFVRQDGEFVRWKYNIDQMPKKEEDPSEWIDSIYLEIKSRCRTDYQPKQTESAKEVFDSKQDFENEVAEDLPF